MNSKAKSPRGKRPQSAPSPSAASSASDVSPVAVSSSKHASAKSLSKSGQKGSAAATMQAMLDSKAAVKVEAVVAPIKTKAPSVLDAPETPKASTSTLADPGFVTPLSAKAKAPPQTASAKKKGAATREASSDKENESDAENKAQSKKSLIGRGAGLRRFQEAQKSNATVLVSEKVQKIYKLVHKSTGALGGNGYDGAIYGELTMHSMQKIVNILTSLCEMDAQSRFIDVGSGLGKPNFHVAQSPGVRLSVGIELEHIRWQLAMYNLSQTLPEVRDRDDVAVDSQKLEGGVHFLCGDIFDTATMDPFTHVYMYDLGFPPPLQQKIAENFNNSVHCKYLISYRPPHRVLHEYGYLVTPIAQIPTSMHGSGEIHTAYFYRRANTPSALVARPGVSLIKLRGRPHVPSDKAEETIACADLFKKSVLLAAGAKEDGIIEDTQAAVATLISASRPKRERKPRILALA